MKKIISLLVCAAMLTMLAPLGAMAASNIVTYTEDFANMTIADNTASDTRVSFADMTGCGKVAVTDMVPVFTQNFDGVTEDSKLTCKVTPSFANNNLTVTTTEKKGSVCEYDIADITSSRNKYSVEFDLSVSDSYVDLGLRYVVRIYSDGYKIKPESGSGYNDKVSMDFTNSQKVKFVINNKVDEKIADVSLYIGGELVQEKMPIPLNSSGVQVNYGTLNELRIDSGAAQTITIDNIVVAGSPIDGNVLEFTKTGTGAQKTLSIIPLKSELCNAKNFTLEFDFVPEFEGKKEFFINLGANYKFTANNGGTAISKLDGANMKDDDGNTATNAFTSMGEKSHMKIAVNNASTVDLYINDVRIARNTEVTEALNKIVFGYYPSHTGTLYLDNFKLTLHDDYLLSADHDGEKFNVNYYVKGAANLYKASYDGEGMLQGVSVEPLTASETDTITVEPISAVAGISSMRFFIWDNNLVPLVNSASAAAE